MSVDRLPEILLPFGIDRWSVEDVRITRGSRGAVRVDAPFPCILIRPEEGMPLRLHGGASALFSQRKPAGQDDPFASVRDQLKSLCDPWLRPAWDFVDAYFGTIEHCIASERSAILEQSIGGCTLYEARDWIYAAPCPLPRAHLHAPPKDAPPDAPADELSIKVDFAFWNGRNFVAVDFGRSRFLPRAAKQREERLLDAGIALVETTPGSEAAWAELVARLLPPSRDAFWRGETLPMGLFPSDALDALDEMVAG